MSLAKTHGGALPAAVDVKALQEFLEQQGAALSDSAYKELCINVIRLMGRGEYLADQDEGHFALATLNYTHSTAPNRRYPDLVNQRMIISALAKQAR